MKTKLPIFLLSLVAIGLLFTVAGAAELPHAVVWDDSQNQSLWTHNVNRSELAAEVSQPKPNDRERVQINPQLLTLFSDNGLMIRGEHLRSSALIFDIDDPNSPINIVRAMDINIWTRLVERHNLNTVRYILYRPPQFWTGGPGWNCPVERCFTTVQDALPYIDAAVEIASDMGMYLIIDYHPVLGHSAADARAWWEVLAPRYKDRTHVIYEVANEPVAGGASGTDAADIAFEEEMYQLIRSLAPDTHIILWSFADYDGALPVVQAGDQINYDNASVAYHPYAWHLDDLDALRSNGYPLIASEVGDNLGSPPPDSRGYRLRTERQEAEQIAWIWLDGTGWGKPWENTDPVPITWPRDPKTGRPTVTQPVIEPATGSYPGGVDVTLSFPSWGTLGAEIRYTLDGSEPTAQSRLYQGPFAITAPGTTVVKAKGFKYNYNSSSTVSTSFLVGDGPTFTPTATGTPTATASPTGTATTAPTATNTPVTGSNLLRNGDFSDGFTTWQKNPTHNWVQIKDLNGDNYIATWPWNNYTVHQDGIVVQAGQTYQACVTLRTSTSYPYQVRMQLVSGGSNLGLDRALAVGETCATFTATSGSSSARFQLIFSGLTTGGTRLDFDNLFLGTSGGSTPPTNTPTFTATAPPANTATPTNTPVPAATATNTPVPANTATATATATQTAAAPTATNTPTPEPVTGENLLQNGDFSDGFAPWQKEPTHNWVQIKDTGGDNYIATWPWNGYIVHQDDVTIVGGRAYEACVTLATTTTAPYQVRMQLVSGGTNLGLDRTLAPGETCTTFTATANRSSARFQLYFSGLRVGGTRLDFDNLFLGESGGAAATATATAAATQQPQSTATATATNTPPSAPTATSTPAATATATATAPPASGEDLLQNGGFDNGFDGWNKDPGHSWVQIRGTAADPHIAVWPWNGYLIWQDGFSLTSGTAYEACVEMFTDTTYPYAVALQIGDGSTNAGLQEQLTEGQNCFTFSATRTTANGRFELVFSGLSRAGTRLDFDDMQLRRTP